MANATDVLKVFSHYHKRTVVLSSGAISGYGDAGSAWGSNSPYAEFQSSPIPLSQRLFGNGENGFVYYPASSSNLYQDAAGTTRVVSDGDPVGRFTDQSGRNNFATSLGSSRPVWQSGPRPSLLMDGTSNYLLSVPPRLTFTLMVKARLTNGGSIRVMAGASDAATANRFQFQTNVSDVLACRIGSGAQLDGSGPSRLNTTFVGGFQYNGSTVSMIEDGQITTSAAQSGVPTIVSAIALGGFNMAGTVTNYFTGLVYAALGIDRLLTAAEIAAVTSTWGTAP